MSICMCPICKKEYSENIHVCDCGYDNLQFYIYGKDDNYDLKETFYIYKYTKNVFLNKIEFEKENLYLEEDDNHILIRDIDGKNGLAIIEVNDNKHHYVVENGIVALNRNVKSLIINADGVQKDIFDESIVKMVFFGKRFKELSDGYLNTRGLRYLYVDAQNPYFTSEDNVMFNKAMSHLICYPGGKIEEQYKVPACVKVIDSYAFYDVSYLKKLFLPKGVELKDSAIYGNENIEILYY